MEEGSTPSPHSELVTNLTVEKGESLEIAAGIETSTKGPNMKIGTNLKISYACSTAGRITFVLVIVGLLGFGAGPVASIGLSRR